MLPTPKTPLLGSSGDADYATIKLKPNAPFAEQRPPPDPPVSNDYVVDIESIANYADASSASFTFKPEDDYNYDMFHCEYCIQNNLRHFPEWDNGSAWCRYMESEGSLAVLESIITLQMRLLSILVPAVLLFVLRIYMIGYIDDRYITQPIISIFPDEYKYFQR
ncbi:hypothetical protein F4804DRAFT_331829 [Jackrogersella minutella]|nr:hypothetical protein F4804DRAFT_331829 [Jackrogersella minutella]